MRQFIARCTAWFRAFGFGTHAREEAAPEFVPIQAPEPPPSSPSCNVYLWATAHGIDLSYPGPLGSCTCAAKPHPEPSPSEALRAKVREANEASRWGK
ncbi:hypothetical protein [Streptosporangium nondiastaticum]|uniref:hypothetical protein n=1 Tax=Streptosporangium nondiastaticum TaxID=35764 RepID=UPI0011B27F07|nr:hypothetical protein [Streptosporangium nondiastaticum]